MVTDPGVDSPPKIKSAIYLLRLKTIFYAELNKARGEFISLYIILEFTIYLQDPSSLPGLLPIHLVRQDALQPLPRTQDHPWLI